MFKLMIKGCLVMLISSLISVSALFGCAKPNENINGEEVIKTDTDQTLNDETDGETGSEEESENPPLETVFMFELESEETYAVSGIETLGGTEIVIPSEYNSKPVVAVKENAFKSSGITKVTIPSSITKLYPYAFDGCFDLSQAIFEDYKGWKAENIIFDNSLSNPSYAATWLKYTHKGKVWEKS